MEGRTIKQNFFEPVSHALADTYLQLRAKPTPFFLVWLCFSLIPQVLIGFLLQDFLAEAMQVAADLTRSGADQPMLNPENPSIFRIFWIFAGIYLLLFFVMVFQSAILASLIRRLRSAGVPAFASLLSEGIAIFPNYLLTVLYTSLRIIAFGLIGTGAGLLLGTLAGDPLPIAFLMTGFLLIIGFHLYGLGPFIHLSLSTGSRAAVTVSQIYYRSHRPTVTGLFVTAILCPMIVVSLLVNLIYSAGFVTVSTVLVGFLRSITLFAAMVVYINFGKNTFVPVDKIVLPKSEE